MKKQLAVFCTLLTGLILSGCSSSFKVQSDPAGAEAFIMQQSGSEKKSIGKTPLEISYEDLYQKAGGSPAEGQFLVLTLDSKDFESETLLVPPQTFGAKSTLVQVKMKASKDILSASQILTRLHNAQKFVLTGQFERAHIECDKALEVDSRFVRAVSMKGSIYYIKKNLPESLKWYEKALSIDSSFDEAVKMIGKIKQETGQK